jgi:homospermidine synthase
MKFDGKILVIGCGSVSQCVLPLLLKAIETPAERITILDFVDNRAKVKDALDRGVNYKFGRITKANYAAELSEFVSAGDLVIDLAWNIGCEEIVSWCHDHRVLYINTSVEEWDPYGEEDRKDPRPYTLYYRQMKLKKMIANWGGNRGPTAIVDHGANPGLVSHFTKIALIDIAKKIIETKPKDPRVPSLESALSAKNFAQLAHLEDVKTIHISERDTQITNQPKEVNEFVNTWSIEGFFEEGVAPAELGWGTHEKYIPEGMHFHESGPQNQTCLTTIGVKTWVRSFVPSGEITGMVIRHGEAFGISDRLTVWENDQAVYRPTVHYAYCPCDAAIASLQELEMRQYDLQANQRIMSDEIIKGRDELGVLLMGHDFNSWWTGSLLDIQECRRLVPHQNATTLQVAISVVGAAMWAMKHPEEGFCLPDDVDHEEVMAVCFPYLGPFLSDPFDWTPLKNLNPKYTHFNRNVPSEEDVWQFTTFMLDPREAQRAKTIEQSKAKSKGILADIATQTGKVRV